MGPNLIQLLAGERTRGGGGAGVPGMGEEWKSDYRRRRSLSLFCGMTAKY